MGFFKRSRKAQPSEEQKFGCRFNSARDVTESERQAMRFIEGTLDGDTTCYFIPNVQAVHAVLRSCGFRVDQTTFTNDHDIIVRCVIR